MGNPIKLSELVESDVRAGLNALIAQFKILKKEKKALIKEIKGKVKSEDITGKDAAKNLNSFSKSVNKLGGEINKLSAAEKESVKLKEKLKIAQSNLGIENEKAKKVLREQLVLTKENIILNDKNAGTLQKINVRNKQLRREREKLNLSTKKGQLRLKEINAELDKNNKVILKNSDAMKKQRLNVGNYTEAIKQAIPTTGALNTITQVLTAIMGILNKVTKANTAEQEASTAAKIATTAATKSLTLAQKAQTVATALGSKALKVFKIALIGTGIGAIVIALGGLVALLTSTQRGIDKANQASAGLGATFEVLRDRLSSIGDVFALLASGDFAAAFDKLKESFTGIGEEIVKDTANAVANEKQLQKVVRVENDLIAVRAASRSEINKLKIISGDVLQITGDRVKAAQRANEIEENLAKLQIAVQKERLKTILTANGEFVTSAQLEAKISDIRNKSLNFEIKSEEDILELLDKKLIAIDNVGQAESTEEDRRLALESISIIFNLEEESFKKRKKLISLISSILDQEARKRQTIEELRIQALDDAREQALAREVLRFEKEKLEASRIGADLEIIEELHQKKLEKIRESFDEKEKLAKEKAIADANKLAREQASVLNEIEQAQLDGRISALERQQDKEAKSIEEAIDKNQQFSVERLKELINQEIELRKQGLENQAEFELSNTKLTADQRELINIRLQNDLADLENTRLDQIKDVNEQILEDEQKTQDELKELRDFGINAAIDALKKKADAAIKTANEEIAATDKQISAQEALAAQGLENSLKFEQEARAEALLAKIEAEKQKERAEKITAFWNLLSNSDSVQEAIAKFGIGEAFARTIEALPAFEEGGPTPDTESLIRVSEKGSEYVVKHGPAQDYIPQLQAMNQGTYDSTFGGHIDNAKFVPNKLPVNDTNIQLLVAETQGMRKDIKNIVPKMETVFDSVRQESINIYKYANRKRTVHQKVPRL